MRILTDFESQQQYRIIFFVTLALSAIAPLATLANYHSALRMFAFIRSYTFFFPALPKFTSN